jgi:hypothetical protein
MSETSAAGSYSGNSDPLRDDAAAFNGIAAEAPVSEFDDPAWRGAPLTKLCAAGIGPLLRGFSDKRPVKKGWPDEKGLQLRALQLGKSPCICWHIGASDPHIAIDIDSQWWIDFCQQHDCDPFTADTWRIERSLTAGRLKLVFTVTAEQRDILLSGRKQVLHDGKELKLFIKHGQQIVVLGNHYDEGVRDDQYTWVGSPDAIAPLPESWFVLLQGLLCGERPLAPPEPERSAAADRGTGEPVICMSAAPDAVKARACLSVLNVLDFAAYEDWIEVGMALHSVGDATLLIDWDEWSQGDPDRYEAGLCIEKWDTFHAGGGLSLGSLIKAAEATGLFSFDYGRGGKPGTPTVPPETTGGINAVIAALGSGWVKQQNGPDTRRELVKGDMATTLHTRLNGRLQFDQLRMLPAVDRVALKENEIEGLHIALSQNGWNISQDFASAAVRYVAAQSPYHPVAAYLNDLAANADVEPIDLADLGSYFNVTDPLQQSFLQIMLLGAAMRVHEPGCDFKTMVVLHGNQTMFKSLALRKLAGDDWFSDTHQKDDKDQLLALHQCWIYEMAELESVTGKRDAGALKALLSSTVDSFRPPYGKGMGRFPRASVFVGTCNQTDFLVDPTGNDRFLVVEIKERIDFNRIERDRDRIWKAVELLYRSGAKPYLSEQAQQENTHRNRHFTEEHEWLDAVEGWIHGKPTAATQASRTPAPAAFSSEQAARLSKCVPDGFVFTNGHAKRIATVLRQLGYVQRQHKSAGQVVRLWTRGA